MQTCRLHDLTHRRVADTSCRIVDDAAQRLLVVGICHNAEVGYHVLDFLALIEAQTAIDAVRNTVFAHLFLKGTALRVGTIEDGKVGEFSMLLPTNALNVVADNHSLLLVAIGRFQGQALALLVLAEDVLSDLSFVLANKTVCRLHDELRRAIVLLQLEELCVLILLLEVQNVIDVGTTEAVDALRIVTHHTDTPMLPRQLQHNLLLRIVGILILIHQHVFETVDVLLTDILMMAEEQEGLHQQVVEVHGVRLTASLHVPIIYIRHLWPFLLCIVGSPRARHILLRHEQMVLSHRDAIGHRRRLIGLVVQLHLLDDTLDQRPRVGLVVDGEIAVEADDFRLGTQDAGKDRVERSHLQPHGPLLPYQPTDTLLHLACRLIGKGQRKNIPRSHIVMVQQVSNLVGQHTGLARACTSYHKLRAVTIRDGLSLTIV